MKKKNQNYSKSEPMKKERVIEETDSVQVQEVVVEIPEVQAKLVDDERFVLKVGEDKWFKAWYPFVLCDSQEEAAVLNSDWARGWSKRIIRYKHLSVEKVKL